MGRGFTTSRLMLPEADFKALIEYVLELEKLIMRGITIESPYYECSVGL